MATTSYDFIIVGGGTAGLVVATRLSEDPSQRILVLEAGADHSEDPLVNTPALFQALLGSDADWSFQTEPQERLGGRTVALSQGKAIGGSSAINAHVFVPPAKGLIDAWETLGNEGWNWDVMQKYFAKAYTSPPVSSSAKVDSEAVGDDNNEKELKKMLGIDGWTARNDAAKGPIQTSFAGNPAHPIRQAWAEAFAARDRSIANDPFLHAAVGSFSALSSIHPETKKRSYAGSAYYYPIKDRANLCVLQHAVAERILFDNSKKPTRAIGVQYKIDNDSEVKTATTSKEVILAAGALQSPKILELSGIGDSKLLRQHGIANVVADLPAVGENLQDHLVCYVSYEAADELETLDTLIRQEPEAIGRAMQEYAGATPPGGMLTSVGVYTYAYQSLMDYYSETEGDGEGGKGQEFLRDLLQQHRPSTSTDRDGDGDTQVRAKARARAKAYYEIAEKTLLNPSEPSGAYLSALAQQVVPVDPHSASSPAGPVPGKFVSFGSMLSQPLSRGSVHIRSSDPAAAPLIDPRYLTHPVDVEVFARHMRHLDATIASSPAFTTTSSRGHNILKEQDPPSPLRCRRDPASHLTDLDAAKRYIRTSAISMWHLGGTCAMLPEDRGGVVDARLRVYGTAGNVRVVDASAVPLVSTANLQATVYAFAERAADLVKEDYGLK